MSAFLAWIVAHEAIVAGAAVAILDLVFALVPSWSSNGILHLVYLEVLKLAGKTPPAA